MPLRDEKDIALTDNENIFCTYCIDEDQKVRSCEAIFEGGVNYFMSVEGFSREYALKVVRKIMNSLPYWLDKKHECLKGEMLSDEEFNRLFCEKKE